MSISMDPLPLRTPGVVNLGETLKWLFLQTLLSSGVRSFTSNLRFCSSIPAPGEDYSTETQITLKDKSRFD